MWFNPGCSKCRVAKEMLDEAGVEYTIRRYLDDPPTAAELEFVLDRLGVEPWDIARMGEPVAAEEKLAELPRDRRQWIDVMVRNPSLIQRPIIVADDGSAVVARSEDAVRQVVERA